MVDLDQTLIHTTEQQCQQMSNKVSAAALGAPPGPVYRQVPHTVLSTVNCRPGRPRGQAEWTAKGAVLGEKSRFVCSSGMSAMGGSAVAPGL